VRVGLNATCFNDRPSGARQRFLGIYGALFASNPNIEFLIYEPADCAVTQWFAGAANVFARPTAVSSAGRLHKIVASIGFWKRQLLSDRLDLFEAFNLPAVRAPQCPTILTVHDVRQIRDDVPHPQRDVYRFIWRHTLNRVDHVIAVSDTIRDELAVIAPATPVTRIYNGIDPSCFVCSDLTAAAATAARLCLPQTFALAVGHLEHRKNYSRLVEAIAVLRDNGKILPLVIVGNEGGQLAEIRATIAKHQLDSQISILRGATDDELRHLYALSRVVVFPSKYEGFGIPLLEAMAAQRPLVTSNIPVFEELTEHQGVYFPPDDAAAMAAQIARLLDDKILASKVVSYGTARVRDFEFPQLAAQVAAIYATLT
jgi:glycosyltransferase involved in cell wall biosynthesis